MTQWNDSAWRELEKMILEADRLGIAVEKRKTGVIVVDAGVAAAGGLEAGLAMAKIGMAGFGHAELQMGPVCGVPWLHVVTTSDHPAGACFLSQAAHWPVQVGDFRAMGSGPACLRNKDLEPGQEMGFDENSGHAVVVLEARDLADENVHADQLPEDGWTKLAGELSDVLRAAGADFRRRHFLRPQTH